VDPGKFFGIKRISYAVNPSPPAGSQVRVNVVNVALLRVALVLPRDTTMRQMESKAISYNGHELELDTA